jgi:hypothetical protein
MNIVLKHDDPRLGSYEPDGSVRVWPDVDVFEHPYERKHATMRRVAGGFVVIPPGADGDIESIHVEGGQAKSQPVRSFGSKHEMTEGAEVK